MLLILILLATLIRVCQTNTSSKVDILNNIFSKAQHGKRLFVYKVTLNGKWVQLPKILLRKLFICWCPTYSMNAIREHLYQEWFPLYHSGNFDVKNTPHSVRLKLFKKVDENLQLVVRSGLACKFWGNNEDIRDHSCAGLEPLK